MALQKCIGSQHYFSNSVVVAADRVVPFAVPSGLNVVAAFVHCAVAFAGVADLAVHVVVVVVVVASVDRVVLFAVPFEQNVVAASAHYGPGRRATPNCPGLARWHWTNIDLFGCGTSQARGQ